MSRSGSQPRMVMMLASSGGSVRVATGERLERVRRVEAGPALLELGQERQRLQRGQVVDVQSAAAPRARPRPRRRRAPAGAAGAASAGSRSGRGADGPRGRTRCARGCAGSPARAPPPRRAARPAARPGCRTSGRSRRARSCAGTRPPSCHSRAETCRLPTPGRSRGQVGQLVVVRGEERLGPPPRGRAPGARPPPRRSRARRRWRCRGRSRRAAPGCARVAWRRMCAVSCISTMNVDWPRRMWSVAPTRVKMRSTSPILAARAGTKRAHLRHQRDERRLAQERGLAAHVGAGEDQQRAAGLVAHAQVVGHERVGAARAPSPGWRPSTYVELVARGRCAA